MPRQPSQAEPTAKANSPLVAAVMIAAAIVLSAAIFMLMRGEKLPPRPALTSLVEDVLSKARAAIAAGDDVAAAEIMVRYLKSHAGDVEVRPLLARTLWRLGERREAELVVDDVLRQSPQLAEALWLKGELVRSRGGENWLAFMKKAADSPVGGSGDYQARLAGELMASGQVDAVREHYDKATLAGSAGPELAEVGAWLAMQAGDFPLAEQRARQALSQRPAEGRLWRLLAESLAGQDKLNQAHAAIKDGLSKCTRDRGALHLQRGLLLKKHDSKAAAEAFSLACNTPQLLPQAALEAAECYFTAGLYAEAMHHADLAAESRKNDPAVTKLQAMIEEARFPRAK